MVAPEFGIHVAPLLPILGALQDVVFWIIDFLTQGFVSMLGELFAAGTAEFLFFKNPAKIDALDTVYQKSAGLFVSLLSVSALTYLAVMQIFPDATEADPYRFGERAFAALLLVVIGQPMFKYIIMLTNGVGRYIYPDEYELGILVDIFVSVMALLAPLTPFASLSGLISMGGSVISTILVFWLVLAIRMLLIYTVYGLFPLFVALWVVDLGPMKYGKMVAELMFKVTAILLIFGILISGILFVSSALAGGTGSDVAFSDQPQIKGGQIVSADGTDGGSFAGSDGEFGGGAANPLLQLFAFIGGIWLSIAVTTSGLGMLISTRGASGAASRARQGRSPDPDMGGGAGVRESTGNMNQSMGGGGGGGGQGQMHSGGGGGADMMGEGAPEPDSMSMDDIDDSVPLTEQAGNAAAQGRDMAADKAEDFGQSMQEYEGVGSGLANRVGSGAEWSGNKMRGVSGSKYKNKMADSKLGDAASKAKSMGETYKRLGDSTGWDNVGEWQKMDFAKPKATDEDMPEGVDREDMPDDLTKKEAEQIPHAAGAAEEGYGQDPYGAGDPEGRSWEERHGGPGGAEAPVDEDLRDESERVRGGDPATEAGETTDPQADRHDERSSYTQEARTADQEEMQDVYDSSLDEQVSNADVGESAVNDQEGGSYSGGDGGGGGGSSGSSGSSGSGNAKAGGGSQSDGDTRFERAEGREHAGTVDGENQTVHDVEEGQAFDVEEATVKNTDVSTNDETGVTRKKATLETENGEEMEAIAWEDGDGYETPDLEQGDTVNIDNAMRSDYNTSDPAAHSSAEQRLGEDQDYPQVKLTPSSSVSKQGSGMSDDAQETWDGE